MRMTEVGSPSGYDCSQWQVLEQDGPRIVLDREFADDDLTYELLKDGDYTILASITQDEDAKRMETRYHNKQLDAIPEKRKPYGLNADGMLTWTPDRICTYLVNDMNHTADVLGEIQIDEDGQLARTTYYSEDGQHFDLEITPEGWVRYIPATEPDTTDEADDASSQNTSTTDSEVAEGSAEEPSEETSEDVTPH